MCGIGGTLRFDGAPVASEALAAMGRALAHRGPDGAGRVVLGPCGLVHRRLSIIDLSPAGRQPMRSAEGRLWLTYNGEVYNYVELRAELVKRGAAFHSETDSEVILAAYRAWGKDAFARFNGMWGFALWDEDARELILCRDRFGVKPLHLHRDAKRLLFASEVKGLLAADPSLARLDRRSLARFLERPYLSFNRTTLFEGVESLEPGTFLSVRADGTTERARWYTFRPPASPARIGMEDAAARVKETLTDAVRLRFRSDVPVGTCLSGGIDSSSIVALSKKALGKAPDTFSVLYEHPEFSETRFVRRMIDELGLTAHEVHPDGADLPDVLARATYHQEFPTAGPGIYSQWHVMQLARGRVKVLLDGQGGDELFAGYFHNFVPAVRRKLRELRHGDAAAVQEILRMRSEIRALTGTDPVEQMLLQIWRPRRQKYWIPARNAAIAEVRGLAKKLPALASLLPPVLLDESRASEKSVLSPRAMRALVDDERASWPMPRVTGDPLTDTLWDELVRTSIPSLLHYEDRDSMAFSIEARTPFLDYRLVELAFELPAEVKIEGATTKAVLRRAMQGVLPEEIRERRDKKGYPTPFAHWVRGPHREWLRDLVLSERALARGVVEPIAVRVLLDEHDAGKDHAWELFRLATLEIFLRRFMDGPFVADAPPSWAREETGVASAGAAEYTTGA